MPWLYIQPVRGEKKQNCCLESNSEADMSSNKTGGQTNDILPQKSTPSKNYLKLLIQTHQNKNVVFGTEINFHLFACYS